MIMTSLYKNWQRIPILIRAIVMGLLVGIVGLNVITVLGILIPMPWAFLVVLLLLILYIQYFRGKGNPISTRVFRSTHFRSIDLPRTLWLKGMFLALLFIVIEQSGLIVTFRLIEFPAERFTEEYGFLESVPRWSSWLYVVSIALVAGICEEVGFRGYMQLPLEKKYGPVVAIAIVSLLFLLVHLHQAWSGPILMHIFVLSALFGVIAYVTNSLIPGIIAHVVMDVFNFAFWWSPIGWQFDKQPIGTTGMDNHFILWISVLVVTLFTFIVVARNLWKRSNERLPQKQAADGKT